MKNGEVEEGAPPSLSPRPLLTRKKKGPGREGEREKVKSDGKALSIEQAEQ